MNSLNQAANRINILLVDDNPDNLRLLSNILNKHGYLTRRVISGKMALQAAKANNFHLILLDINMPDMDGYEVCRQLKSDSQTVSIPVIFISALNEVIDKIKAFNVGGADYISIPFQFEEVIARIENQVQILNLQQELLDFGINLEQKVDERTKQLQTVVKDLKKSQKQLLQNSLKDPITNLSNHISFMGQLRQSVRQVAIDSNYCFALIVFDCYSPQLINHAFELQVEDSITLEIAHHLSHAVTAKSIARLRDREFAIIIDHQQDVKQVSKITINIQEQLNSLRFSHKLAIKAHYGISLSTKHFKTAEEMLRNSRTIARQGKNQNYCDRLNKQRREVIN